MQTVKPQEFELRAVNIKGPQKPLARQRGGQAIPKRPPAPTRAQALEAMRAAKNADSVFKLIPMLAQPEKWIDAGYWNISQKTGPAATAIWIWDCDFPDGSYVPFSEDDRVFFAGPSERFGEAISPPDVTGQIWFEMKAPATGWYNFVVQLATYEVDQQPYPNYESIVELVIDDRSLGTVSLFGAENAYPFVAHLEEGAGHLFKILQKEGAFYFWGLTVWQLPDRLPFTTTPGSQPAVNGLT